MPSYTASMSSSLAMRPLVRWDGFEVQIDLDMAELIANRELARRGSVVRHVDIGGDGDELEVHVVASWRGFPAQLSARVGELRLHRRFFGCRVAALHGPMGVPLPAKLLGALVRRFGQGLLSFDPDDRILLVDLRRFLPEGLEVRVRDVRCRERWLCVDLAGGAVAAVLAGVPGEGV